MNIPSNLNILTNQGLRPELQFEVYIQQLLQSTQIESILIESITTNIPISQTKKISGIESLLLEDSLTVYFNLNSYSTLDKKNDVLHKLSKLKSLVQFKSKIDLIIVDLCTMYVCTGYSLTKNIMLYLNSIYKHYA